jgi:surfeit locus 1 family protein
VNYRRIGWMTLAVALAAAFCALGAWQLGRAQWKLEHREALLRARTLAPVGLAAALAAGGTLSQANATLAVPGREGLPRDAPLRVAGSGRFDNAATVLLDNEVREGRVGVRVYTLFRPARAQRSVLVDRGWIPLARDATPAIPPVNGRVAVAGILRSPPAIGLRLGNAQFVRGAEPPRLAYVDVAALRGQMGVDLVDAVLEPDTGAPYVLGPARTATADPMTPERHRGYAVQWFALAVAVLALAGYLTWKSRA